MAEFGQKSLDKLKFIDNNAGMTAKTRRRRPVPRTIKCLPKSRRLYEAIEAAAREDFTTLGRWLLKLASKDLGVPDSDVDEKGHAA